MKLYKYRTPNQIEYIFDILLNNQLYCSNWTDLNDPMEGHFLYFHEYIPDKEAKEKLEKIVSYKQKVRICSLSKRLDNFLLWVHYADAFQGLCIEVDVPPGAFRKKVNYVHNLPVVPLDSDFVEEEMAELILTSKLRHWIYEKEFRILHSGPMFELKKRISRVILGHRMDKALVKAISVICEGRQIPVDETFLTSNNITTKATVLTQQSASV